MNNDLPPVGSVWLRNHTLHIVIEYDPINTMSVWMSSITGVVTVSCGLYNWTTLLPEFSLVSLPPDLPPPDLRSPRSIVRYLGHVQRFNHAAKFCEESL